MDSVTIIFFFPFLFSIEAEGNTISILVSPAASCSLAILKTALKQLLAEWMLLTSALLKSTISRINSVFRMVVFCLLTYYQLIRFIYQTNQTNILSEALLSFVTKSIIFQFLLEAIRRAATFWKSRQHKKCKLSQ